MFTGIAMPAAQTRRNPGTFILASTLHCSYCSSQNGGLQMNKSTMIGLIAGVGIAATAAGIAGYAVMDERDEQGSLATANATRCEEVQVETSVEPRDDKRIAGTVIGALVGGAVGNDVGNSDVTTAAGAAAGAYAGRKAQESFQDNRTETETEIRC
jgi:uncharacterized protein YcfJ